MNDKNYKPSWQPENCGKEFACSVMPGKKADNEGLPGNVNSSKKVL